jgi:aspartyl-tRNA(Asn)/glutamyl-tRNA(Gln) amidotransferase subunit C
MHITKDLIRHVAALARLHFGENEEERYEKELSSILEYVEVLQSVPTKEEDAFIHAASQTNVWREDHPDQKTLVRANILDSFSEREGDLLKVQAIFEGRQKEEEENI